MDYGVLFSNNADKKDVLEGYLDWCGDRVDRKNITGFIFKFLEAPNSWYSEIHHVISLSSCEAEYIASLYAACQALWLESLLSKMMIEVIKLLQLMVDNKSTINLTKNLVSHGCSKHIETRLHFLRDQVTKGKVSLSI